MFKVFHGSDDGGCPVFVYPLCGQSPELGDQVGVARRPIRLAPGQIDLGFKIPRLGAVSGESEPAGTTP